MLQSWKASYPGSNKLQLAIVNSSHDLMDKMTGDLPPGWHDICPSRSSIFVMETPEGGNLSVERNKEPGEPVKLEMNTVGWRGIDFSYKGFKKRLAIYSAYYDDRLPNSPVVRVISMLPHKVPPLNCTVSVQTPDNSTTVLFTAKASAHGSR